MYATRRATQTIVAYDGRMGRLKVGAARVSITPPVGYPLCGYGAREGVSTGIHDEPFAKALVIDDGTQSLAIIAVDLALVDTNFTDTVREGIHRQLGIPKHHIMIAASHTHSGPAGFVWPACPSDLPTDPLYVEMLGRKLVGVTCMAARRAVESRIGTGEGMVMGVGTNRNDPSGPMDPSVKVLYVISRKGKPLAALVNHACHPTVLGPDNLLVSADFPAYASAVLEQIKGEGFIALFTNGALGDISTRLTRRSQTFDEARRLGTLVGAEALKTVERIENMSSDVELRGASYRFVPPLRKFPPLAEALHILKEARSLFEGEKSKGGRPDCGRLRMLKACVEGAEETVRLIREWKPQEMITEVQVLAIGDTLLVALPGEAFVEIGLSLKAKLAPSNVFIIGCANDYLGYILTREACEEKKYEAGCNLFAPELDSVLEEVVLELVASSIRGGARPGLAET